MENFNRERAEEIHQRILAQRPSICQETHILWDFIMASEYELILYMVSQKVWQGVVPPPPANFEPGNGSIELGMFRYWAQDPLLLDLSGFDWEDAAAIVGLCLTIDGCAPSSQLTDVNYGFFKNNELIYTDGSVLGMEKYATYDQGWFIAFLNLLQTFINYNWYNRGNFPTVDPPVIPLSGASSNEVNIALVGDWGTGDATAQAVMKQLVSLNPDYIVHVGDVYYSGSPLAGDPNASIYFSPGEEGTNLIEGWPSSYAGKSFTLNSNHEMYSGANGYFYDALLPQGSFFSAQKGSSCWALQYGGWTILGLDSAFMGSSLDAFMSGSLGGADGVQRKWITSLNLDPDKVIVLTHHNGFSPDGKMLTSLWEEIIGTFNKKAPYAWYWGHVHYGIVYNCPMVIQGVRIPTYARCLGHGALPYGLASSLSDAPVAWSCTNKDSNNPPQLANGFAMLTLKTYEEGQLISLIESFYDISTNKVAWSMDLLK